jgi:lipoprotein NlpI
MRRLVLALLVFCAPAFAGTYDDFSRGIDANNHGDADAAIQAFTKSLEGGDLAPSYVPSALLGRARALLHDRRCELAFADLSNAIRLRPDFVDAYSLRAEADQCLERDQAALADATAAIHLKPAAGFYFTRARLLWGTGSFVQARDDADAAAARDPTNPYVTLWQAMMASRTGAFDPNQVAQRAATASGWPKPLLDLYAGRAAAQDVRHAAESNAGQKCEANFYVGEWELAHGNKGEARKLIAAAANECPRDFIAFDGARRELKRM